MVGEPLKRLRPLNNLKNLALWIIIAVLLVVLFNVFQNTGTKPANPPITYTKFLEQVQKNEMRSVTFQGDKADRRICQPPALHHYRAQQRHHPVADAEAAQCRHQGDAAGRGHADARSPCWSTRCPSC